MSYYIVKNKCSLFNLCFITRHLHYKKTRVLQHQFILYSYTQFTLKFKFSRVILHSGKLLHSTAVDLPPMKNHILALKDNTTLHIFSFLQHLQ